MNRLIVLDSSAFFKEISQESYGKLPKILCDIEVHDDKIYNDLIEAQALIKFDMICTKIILNKNG